MSFETWESEGLGEGKSDDELCADACESMLQRRQSGRRWTTQKSPLMRQDRYLCGPRPQELDRRCLQHPQAFISLFAIAHMPMAIRRQLSAIITQDSV